MNRPRTRIPNAARILLPALAFLALSPTLAQAQMWGYGAYGYGGYGGYPAAYAYGYPGYGGVGSGYPNGFPGPGYGGTPGFGMGYGYGYAPYSYGYFGNNFPGVRPPLGSVAGYPNPLFGMGLSPLGVQSGLSEAYLIGATRRRAVNPNPNPIPNANLNPAAQYYGTGSARPR